MHSLILYFCLVGGLPGRRLPGHQVAKLAGSLARVVELPGCRVAGLPGHQVANSS